MLKTRLTVAEDATQAVGEPQAVKNAHVDAADSDFDAICSVPIKIGQQRAIF